MAQAILTFAPFDGILILNVAAVASANQHKSLQRDGDPSLRLRVRIEIITQTRSKMN